MADDPSPKKVLEDHVRQGKRLVPPLRRITGGKYAPYSWTRELVPEALWIWLLIENYGLRRGVELANAVGKAAAHATSRDPKPLFCRMSSFSQLTEAEVELLLGRLSERERAEIGGALAAFLELCPASSMSFLGGGHPVEEEAKGALSKSLEALYDRYGRPTALTLATVTWMTLEQDKMRVAAHLWDKFVEDFEHIADYPNTERSKSAAASFRAGAPMTLMMNGGDGLERNEEWLKYFWDKVGTIGECILPLPFPEDDDVPEDELGKIVVSYRNEALRELRNHLSMWGFDLHNIEVTEVVSALLSRQTTLAIDLAMSPSIWNPQTAPLILRAMADVFVALAWILTSDLKARAARFVDDGLGAVKLEIAHRKAAMTSRDETVDEDAAEYIEMLQEWLDGQRIEHLVEVNLGSWSGLSTRAMAEESGYLSFYNYVYQPFSSAVHSNWFHVGRLNLIPCQNPAHRHHQIGHVFEFKLDPHWLYLAAKYLDKALVLFREKTGTSVASTSAFDTLIGMLNDVGREAKSEDPSTL